MAFLVDIPLCTTVQLPDFNRGYVEKYLHYDAAEQVPLEVGKSAERAAGGKGRGLVLITRADLDDAQRQKREECQKCRYNPQCEGVWGNYLRRYGWGEFEPVPAAALEGEKAGAGAQSS